MMLCGVTMIENVTDGEATLPAFIDRRDRDVWFPSAASSVRRLID